MNEQQKAVFELVKAAVAEDVGSGDITSLGSLEPGPIKARIVANSAGVVSGAEPAAMVYAYIDSANTIHFLRKDGERFAPGDVIAEIEGFNRSVLSSERVALNFLGHLSGVATLTSEFVAKAAGTRARILDTRKTLPGWRYLEKRAVVHGGGLNHRMGLYDMVLIKDNHIASAGSIEAAVRLTREYMDTPDFRMQFKTDASQIKIEVEVESEPQLRQAAAVGVDRLLLDNQSIESLSALVRLARELAPAVELEASGNVTLATVAAIAATGVDFISIGAITHSAPVCDFSMRVIE
jgi:nicotinate-nucleotide pyrophosphorylase (carboxylating)